MDKTNPAPGESGDGAEIGKADNAYLSPPTENINTPSRADTSASEDRHRGPLKDSSARGQRTTRVSAVRWVINERYGLGRDQSQFIVYRTRTPKPGKLRRKEHRQDVVAFFTTIEAALMWVIMRQVHFEDDPTIDTDILDAFQSYCHHLDRVNADIRALAERIEAALP